MTKTQFVAPRVEGDLGPPLTVSYAGFETTGWTITARITKASGEEYTLPAVIDDIGDIGAGVDAEFHFDFTAGNLVRGDQLLDLHFAHATVPDFSLPGEFRLTMRVREP